jgi:hypothetical protein
MSEIEVELPEGQTKVICPTSVIDKIESKYTFEFNYNGSTSKCYLIADEIELDGCSEKARLYLSKLIERIHRTVASANDAGFDTIDVYNFVSLYTGACAQIEEELQRVPFSKRRLAVSLFSNPSYSLDEEQRLLELIQKQYEKALAAKKVGEPKDAVEVTITEEMVRSMLAKKMRQTE